MFFIDSKLPISFLVKPRMQSNWICRVHRFAAMCVLLLTITSVPEIAQRLDFRMSSAVRTANIGSTKTSLYAVDLTTGFSLVKKNVDEAMIPASNLKLITTAAALHTLGKEFSFATKLTLLNPPKALDVKTGQMGAMLLVQGDGDPTFGDADILRKYGQKIRDVEQLIGLWVDAVKKAQIKTVQRIIVDDSVFDRTFVHPSWPRDQLNRWYCAQVSGLNFYTNCLDVYPKPTKRGDGPLVQVIPESPFIPKTNLAVTGSSDTFWISRKLGTNQIAFRGKVRHQRTKPVHVTIHDPPIYFAQLFADRLIKAGIGVKEIARPMPNDNLNVGRGLHIIRTPLHIALTRCNKNSQNLYAEALFKRMGRHLTGSPGSFENGAAAARIFLQKTVGTAAASVRTADGSGLSRQNFVTTRVMVDVLAAMHKNAKLKQVYRQSLSIAGVDGTLYKRMKDISGIDTANKQYKARVYAKTGYINGVSALSGYLVIRRKGARANGKVINAANGSNVSAQDGTGVAVAGDDDGRVIAFSFLFNNLKSPLGTVMHLQDELVKILHDHYVK